MLAFWHILLFAGTFAIAFKQLKALCVWNCGQSPSDQIQDANDGCPLRCGRAPNPPKTEKAQFRILGGDQVEEVYHPWLFQLRTQNECNRAYICTATLISARHLLTSAHCVFKDVYECKRHPSGKNRSNFIPYSLEEMRAERRGVTYEVKQFWTSEEFNENELDGKSKFVGDIAILELDSELSFVPACLAKSFSRAIDKVANVTGYGEFVGPDSAATAAGNLRQAEVEISSVEVCRATWGQSASLCAGSAGKGGMNGHSGSLLTETHFGLHFGIGVYSSFWPGNGRDSRPDIYVALSRHCSWLKIIAEIECVDTQKFPVECMQLTVSGRVEEEEAEQF